MSIFFPAPALNKSSRKMSLQPQSRRWKNISRTRRVSVWNQIKPVYNGKNIKPKPLTNTSQVKVILTLKLIISKKIWLQCQNMVPHVRMHDMKTHKLPRLKCRPKQQLEAALVCLDAVIRPRNRRLSVSPRGRWNAPVAQPRGNDLEKKWEFQKIPPHLYGAFLRFTFKTLLEILVLFR